MNPSAFDRFSSSERDETVYRGSTPPIGEADIPIIARGRAKPTGKTTGGFRACSLESCGGVRVRVRWAGGQVTFPCTRGMALVSLPDKRTAWRILE